MNKFKTNNPQEYVEQFGIDTTSMNVSDIREIAEELQVFEQFLRDRAKKMNRNKKRKSYTETKSFIQIKDPCFYQYTDYKELKSFNTSELTIALSVLRKEQRRLKEKVYQKMDRLDKENLKMANKRREEIEQLLFIKQGFIPEIITQKMINTIIVNNQRTVTKLKKTKILEEQI